MTSPIIKLGPGIHVPDASWDQREIWFDLWRPNEGKADIHLPAAASLPDGFSCILHKRDPMSHAVEFRPTAEGDRLNHFWVPSSPFGRYLNLTQQSARLSCDGEHDYSLAGMTLHRNVPQSQRTLYNPSGPIAWDLAPVSENEIVRCNCEGGSIAVVINGTLDWCPPSPELGGNNNYHSFVFSVQKTDDSPNWVSIWMADGSPIRFANGEACQPGAGHGGYVFLTRKGDHAIFYMAADGCCLNTFDRPGATFRGI